MKQRKINEEWSIIIFKCERSNLPTADWCKAHHISTSTYYRKRKQLTQRLEEKQSIQ